MAEVTACNLPEIPEPSRNGTSGFPKSFPNPVNPTGYGKREREPAREREGRT